MSETIYMAKGSDLTALADKIREKTGGSEALQFPSGFIAGVNGLANFGATSFMVGSSNTNTITFSGLEGKPNAWAVYGAVGALVTGTPIVIYAADNGETAMGRAMTSGSANISSISSSQITQTKTASSLKVTLSGSSRFKASTRYYLLYVY